MSGSEEAAECGGYILPWHANNGKFRAQRRHAEVEYLPYVVGFQAETGGEAGVERTVAGGNIDKTGKCLLVRCAQSADAQADFILLGQCKRRKSKQKDEKARGLTAHEFFLLISTRDTASLFGTTKAGFLAIFSAFPKEKSAVGQRLHPGRASL